MRADDIVVCAQRVADRARDMRSNRIVALKKVRMEKEKDGIPITCLREVKILKEVDHPNIVRLLGVTVGRQLDAYVAASPSTPTPCRVSRVCGVCVRCVRCVCGEQNVFGVRVRGA
mgnify:CR=1 FL=1